MVSTQLLESSVISHTPRYGVEKVPWRGELRSVDVGHVMTGDVRIFVTWSPGGRARQGGGVCSCLGSSSLFLLL